MKKIIALLSVLLLISFSVNAQDLEFTYEGGGKFIYCNNPEPITDDVLMNGDSPSYVMNNSNLGPGKYYVYISHFNYTGSGKLGYDIELDLEMTPATDECTYTVDEVGFETNKVTSYIENGKWIKQSNDWGLLNCCATMLGKPISTIDGEEFFYPTASKSRTYSSDTRQTRWLSSDIPNYAKVGFYQPVHIQALIIVKSGELNLNVCAFKSGEKLGDRSDFNPKAKFGEYRRDKTLKGVADTLPKVNAQLEYSIDDNTADGECLPVTVKNQYVPEGNTITQWLTNLSPQSDIWSKRTLAESDMVRLAYKDKSKLQYYGESVNPESYEDTWYFDSFRSDTKAYEAGFNVEDPNNYSPNFLLTTDKANEPYACNIGNYGVTETYKLKVTNSGSKTRYLNYVVNTASNILVYKTDSKGRYDSVYAKKPNSTAKSDVMASVELPPNQTTEFTLNLILPVNYNGGMKNQFFIEDTPKGPEPYEDLKSREPIRTEYKPIMGCYLSEIKHLLPQETYKKFEGNFDNYEVLAGDDCYILRWCNWDGRPYYYYYGWKYTKTVYVLDKNYKLKNEHTFETMPIAMTFDNSTFYIQTVAMGVYSSADGKTWNLCSDISSLPMSRIPDPISKKAVPAWAGAELDETVKSGIVPYDLKDVNCIENNITRAEFCHAAIRMLKVSNVPIINNGGSFTDTDSEEILALNSMGIVSGYEDKSFRPENLITREEAAVILTRLYEYNKQTALESKVLYSDNDDISMWAKEYVYKMRNTGIMLGVENNNFSAHSNYTRLQSFLTLYRLFKSI